MGQFTGEIIARTGFSLKTDCISKASDDEFTSYTKKNVRYPWKNIELLYANYLTMETSAFVLSQGSPNTDSYWDSLPKTMSEEELLGQSMFLIFAGFDTIATTLQMCSYYLAKHPEVDAKLYEEIQKVVKSDLPTYEEISQLKYMEQVLNETLRLCPPAPIMTRRVLESRTYGKVTIQKGTAVVVSIDMVMKDPKNYPDPEKFDPERFSEQNISSRDPMAFMPFGYGPRQCIGMRLAYMELKICLVHVLRKVKFELNEKNSS